MLLPRETLVALCGYKQPSAIARWLRREGFSFVVGIDGWPRVAVSQFEARMNNVTVMKRSSPRGEGPNRAALEEMQRAKKAS